MGVEELVAGYETLKKLWASKKVDEVGKRLDQLKLALIEMAFLPTISDVSEKVRLIECG